MPEIKLANNRTHYQIIADLAHKIWAEHYTPIIGGEQVSYMLEKYQTPLAIENQVSQGFSYYLLQDHHTPVGYFAFQNKKDALFLSKLYVLKIKRGNGIAKFAISFLEKCARDLGMLKIELTVNKHNTLAIAAYLQMGFKNVAAIVQDIGNGYVMDDYVLEKIIP
ncbi:GNAT family N-acetyltransferase [Pareuzebyella sediminis]|uniref:GNAT family N-acetyltransferase n=1 Tax=Pareuzebyella sediminis TaxID=2607998 RepID=UPI0011F088D1|nr:GNAT family N-acetyltransferase [Pareuzebyella sediminis]